MFFDNDTTNSIADPETYNRSHNGKVDVHIDHTSLPEGPNTSFVAGGPITTYHLHPLKSWEFWCGDGIYNSCYGVLTRFRLVAKGVFTRLEVFMNSYINHHRQRVEHVMHTIKDHAMWSGKKLKCSYAMIYWSMRLTVHLTNIKIKHGWADEAYHK